MHEGGPKAVSLFPFQSRKCLGLFGIFLTNERKLDRMILVPIFTDLCVTWLRIQDMNEWNETAKYDLGDQKQTVPISCD